MYETRRLILRLSNEVEAEQVLEYYVRNREFFKPYEPERPNGFFTLENQKLYLQRDQENLEGRRGMRFWLSRQEEPDEIMGTIALNGIMWGGFRSSFLGYKLDCNHAAKGYMTEAVERVVSIAFHQLKLHRLEANVMHRNYASVRVVEKLGFEQEGISRKYMNINGRWEDHVHMVLLNPAVENTVEEPIRLWY